MKYRTQLTAQNGTTYTLNTDNILISGDTMNLVTGKSGDLTCTRIKVIEINLLTIDLNVVRCTGRCFVLDSEKTF